MTEIKILPLTHHYILELCRHQDGVSAIGIGDGAGWGEANVSLDELLERMYPSEEVRVDRARKLDLLVRWHKMLASRSASGVELLADVEQQIFRILRGEKTLQTAAPEGAFGGEGDAAAQRIPEQHGMSDVAVSELLQMCNHICETGIRYLGGVTSTYLASSRPDFDWLQAFEIQRSGRLRYAGSDRQQVSVLELYWCRRWMEGFISQCSEIVQGFADALDARAIERLGLDLQAGSDDDAEALMAGFSLE